MLLTFATKNYLPWMDLLLRTYKKTNPDRETKIYLIMGEEDFKQFSGQARFFEYRFRWIPEHQSLNMEIDSNKVKSALRLKTSIILWELILNPGKPLLWADADTIVLKDVQPILDKLEEYDFLCTERPWKPVDQQKLAAAVMGFRSNPTTIEFMARAAQDVWGHWEGWYSDQLNIYNNLTPKIRHYSFTEQEHSIKNDENTIFLSHHANKFWRLEELCNKMGA